jgi:Tfp pilus assembly protein PilN
MEYVILIIALAVTCFAGVQLCYLMFLQATNRQQQRRIAELERELIALRRALREPAARATDETEEVWSELIDDGAGQ